MSKWDSKLGRNEPLPKRRCGENRFIGIINILEIYLRPGCELEVRPKDSIMSKVRLSWTLNEFYADGGTVKFADRIAAVLGIHASTIKVVAVYKGSVIIDFFIMAEDNDPDADKTLQNLSEKFSAKLASGDVFLGAPILGAYTGGENISVPQSDGSRTKPAGFSRPNGAAPVPVTNNKKKQGSAFEWDENEQGVITSNDHSTPTVGTVGKNSVTETEEKNKAQVYIVLLSVAGAVLVAIVLAVAVRFCFLKRAQNNAVDRIKEANSPEPELDHQAHGRDFDDVFAATNQTAKVNMADGSGLPGGVNMKDLSH